MIRFRHFAIVALALTVSTAGAFAYTPCGIPEPSVIDHADPLRRPIAELDGSGTLIRRFIWGRGIVAQVEANGSVHYFHHDGQGSTLALSDTNSITTDTWFYSPYGEVMSRTGSTVTPYQWCGGVGVRRTANGLYFARHRYYHAGLKRWIARDPIGIEGGVNLYAYAGNSPWLYYDPYGLCAEGSSYDPPVLRQGTWSSPSDYVSRDTLRAPSGSAAIAQANLMVPAQFQGTAVGQGLMEIQSEFIVGAFAEPGIHMGLSKLGKLFKGVGRGVPKNLKALRGQYVDDVNLLDDIGFNARAAGQSTEATARMMHAERNALKLKYRNLSPADAVKKFELRNIDKYGNPLGPSIEQLRGQGRTWEQIIDSASRSGGADLGL